MSSKQSSFLFYNDVTYGQYLDFKISFRISFTGDASTTQIWSQCYGLHAKNKRKPQRNKVCKYTLINIFKSRCPVAMSKHFLLRQKETGLPYNRLK
jgi:hypothetical protein